MNNAIEILDWDSNFFGIKVCRVNGIISDRNELSDVLKELDKLDIDLGYYSSPLPLKGLQNISLLYNCNLVDKKITYLKRIIRDVTFNDSVTEFRGEYPDDKLFELAVESGIYSRFNVDRKIGRNKYEELYKQWIINSVSKKLAMKVFVYVENKTIIGLVTLGEKNARADIGIIAVDSHHRGRGIGKALMLSAENWFANQDYNYIQVVTQGENLPACRLYEICGYRIDKIEYFYHFWKEGSIKSAL